MSQLLHHGLDFGNMGLQDIKGLELVKQDLVSDRDTQNVGPAIDASLLVKLCRLTRKRRRSFIDPDTDHDLQIQLEALNGVQGLMKNVTIRAIESNTSGCLDQELELLVDRGLSVEAARHDGADGYIGHAIKDASEGEVCVWHDRAVGSNHYWLRGM